MFEYIKGKLVAKKVDYAAIDTGGTAYKLFISLNTYDKLKNDIEKLYVHTYVREDAFILYGFYEEDERELFNILINANGIGPRIAMAILSTYSVPELKSFIAGEEIKMLTKIPGLGIKKAQKLILDVKDKIKDARTISSAGEGAKVYSSYRDDVVMALESLGYGAKDITELTEKEDFTQYENLESAIKAVLKKIRL